jgi:hypothetical protein
MRGTIVGLVKLLVEPRGRRSSDVNAGDKPLWGDYDKAYL